MINWLLSQRKRQSRGQALVEFALIITVVLMIIFLIIESARILQGWVTVQNAAREGARYAITGQNMNPCPMDGSEKYNDRCDDLRVASVMTVTHTGLAGLPLNESGASDPFGSPPTDNSYDIQVWGGIITEDGPVLQPDFAGAPGQPVVVRAVYNVPIITPFFRPIIETVPVFGQVMMNNENFGSLGNPTQGQGAPPRPGPLPTVGASPTTTPSPTPSDTPTPGASFTPSATPTITPTNTPELCGLFFDRTPVEGQNFVYITGEIGTEVTIINASTGATLGADVLLDVPGKRCPGFADFSPPNSLNQTLVAGDTLIAQPNDGSQPATAFVVEGTATPTVSPTPVPSLTPTPVITTPIPTYTPSEPYIIVQPDCGVGPDVSFSVQGWNWPTDEIITLFWDGSAKVQIPGGHSGTFSYNLTALNVSGDADNPVYHEVKAVSSSGIESTADFLVPCPYVPTNTPQPEITNTPLPEDLVIVGPPNLLNEPPLIAYKPITVSMTISNIGEIDVSSQFFVDVYFDPVGNISPTIGLTQSVGYMAVSSLDGGASRVVTITAPFGFENEPTPHLVYGMVDSVRQVDELREWNNVSTPLTVTDVTPGIPPTPSPTPRPGDNSISGVIYSRIGNWVPQARAQVYLFEQLPDGTVGNQVAAMQADTEGLYEFMVPAGEYAVRACVVVDQTSYSGLRLNIVPPDPYVDVFLLKGPCS